MITTALIDYFGGEPYFSTVAADSYYRVTGRRRGLFGSTIEAVSLLILKSSDIDFQSAADALVKAITLGKPGEERVSCAWLVCSERGGIYLYEAIATKENRAHRRLKSRFVIVNSLDGTVSFGPGHSLNGRYTDRLRDLIDSYRTQPPEVWRLTFQKLVGELFQVAKA